MNMEFRKPSKSNRIMIQTLGVYFLKYNIENE